MGCSKLAPQGRAIASSHLLLPTPPALLESGNLSHQRGSPGAREDSKTGLHKKTRPRPGAERHRADVVMIRITSEGSFISDVCYWELPNGPAGSVPLTDLPYGEP